MPLPKASTHTYVLGGCVPRASVGDFLALHQAHHPLEMPGVDDPSVVTGLLGVLPIELLQKTGGRLQVRMWSFIMAII